MADANLNPEQKARNKIDRMLEQAGWVVQDYRKIDFKAGSGIAVREYPTDSGPADYMLLVDKKPVGVIEAKREDEAHRISKVEEQSTRYATSELKHFGEVEIPFLYESTGEITRFTDQRDPKPRAREVFSFHRPKTLIKRTEQRSLRDRLQDLPELNVEGLRECQVTAINNLDTSFNEARPKALVQMATGSGKTFTAITTIYRLLKHAGAKRVLFLVDTKNLGEQAEQEFMQYTPSDDNRKFTELYPVQRLQSSYIAPDNKVTISTIQRLYSMMKGEEVDDSVDEENPNERYMPDEPLPVVYNEKIPIEFFDVIVIDECHRSIYNLWKQVLDYFDSFLVGLTATPDKRTFAFFNENVVSEYSHEKAVADGVNVGYDVFTIETKISKEGAKIEAEEFVDKREKLTRKTRWEQLEDEVEYTSTSLDKDIVNPSQIRNIIKAFKNKLPEIFPGRTEIPKTLIFAKTDSHADDIIQMVREEFAEGNEFCKKVTYKIEEDPKSVLAQFRNEYYPRIAVTVDMIATGTDVKPLECLLFMRDVKSRNYFEQMKGRGTRTLDKEGLIKVTPSAKTDKTHFVIVDAVGVTKSVKTDSRPLERKRTVPLKDLLMGIMMGSEDEDFYTSAANRLARLEQQLDDSDKKDFKEKTGKTINRVTHELLDAFNPDAVEDLSESKGIEPGEARKQLIEKASSTFTGDIIDYIDNVRKIKEQIIDVVNTDEVTYAGWDKEQKKQAETLVENFKAFLEEHKDEIAALSIFYNEPYRRREVTFKMMKEVLDLIKQKKPQMAPLNVWNAWEQVEGGNGTSPKNELMALVSLIRNASGIDKRLTPYDKTVNKNFQDWIFGKHAGKPKFSEEQMNWLRMIKDHIATSVHFSKDDLDYAPFDAKGGVGKMYQLFGDEMDDIIEEMNEELVA
ncbi:MAG TPA: type I restriction-modification enzyme R subunit C-terminal domain-containing protein [Gracilimonas sp.]|uniref:type I restriction endonuclease subunit R n=1 Tax=Gracilimonas sp. TaxID=1974203 RepID=UPI002D9ECCEB|nr:type I restriction-modification enzyme R subunit C-terminal domain-containing protein [Gracilimonas sp.]